MKKFMRLRLCGVVAGLIFGSGIALAAGAAEPPRHRYAEGELLVKFKGGARSHAAEVTRERMKHVVKRRFDFIGWQHIRLPEGMSVEQGLARYKAMPEVLAAEPNYGAQAIDSTVAESTQAVSQLPAVPNDPRFGQQWGPSRVGALEAWNVTT